MSRTALIIEPDNARAAAYKGLLDGQGLASIRVRDGDEALNLSLDSKWALILTELALPRRDGFHVLRELKQTHKPMPPVVVVSAFREMRDAAHQLRKDLGITELLATTSSFPVLSRAISRALGAPELRPATPYTPMKDAGAAPGSAEDRERLRKVAMLELQDDRPDDEVLDRLVRETAVAFGVPTALLSVVLEDKQWFKAHVGLSPKLAQDRSTPRDWSFCSRAVEGASPLVVPDAVMNPVFANNPLVKDGTVRGYAGVPLVTPSGATVGSLCIIDQKPLLLKAEELESLRLFARRVAGELELRHQQRQRDAQVRALTESLQSKQRQEEATASAMATLQAVLASLSDGVLVLSSDRRILFCNQRVAELSGVPLEQVQRMTLDQWIAQNVALFDDPTDFKQKLAVLPQGPFAAHEEFEVQRPVRRVIRWVAKPIQLSQGVGQLCLYTDITAEHDLRHERERLAFTDVLTGIANRRALEEALGREAARVERGGSPGGVVLFDLDHFKKVNDTWGHGAGDEVLRIFADALAGQARKTDLVGRWGGEEFLAVLPGVTLEGARLFGERVLSAYRSASIAGLPPQTCSAGVAALSADVSASLKEADGKLYEAKAAGRARVVG